MRHGKVVGGVLRKIFEESHDLEPIADRNDPYLPKVRRHPVVVLVSHLGCHSKQLVSPEVLADDMARVVLR
jgi:hypothetical protein